MRSAEHTFNSLSKALVEAGQALRISQAAQIKAEAESYRLEREVQEQAATIQRLKELLAAKDDLLVAYRLGNNKLADRALTQIEKAKAALGEELERK